MIDIHVIIWISYKLLLLFLKSVKVNISMIPTFNRVKEPNMVLHSNCCLKIMLGAEMMVILSILFGEGDQMPNISWMIFPKVTKISYSG